MYCPAPLLISLLLHLSLHFVDEVASGQVPQKNLLRLDCCRPSSVLSPPVILCRVLTLAGADTVPLAVPTRTVQHTMRFPLPIRTEGRSCAVVPEVKIHLRRCSGDRIGASTASLRPLQAQNGILHNKMTVAPTEEKTMQRHIPSVPLHRIARPDKFSACINLFLPNRHNISFT